MGVSCMNNDSWWISFPKNFGEGKKSWVGLFEEKDRSNTGFEVCRRAVTVFAIVM